MEEKHKFVTTRIWKDSLKTLRKIYAETGESMVSIADRLIAQEWNRIRQMKETERKEHD